MEANHDGRGKRVKILHVCLASSYTEGMTYQDNMLATQNAADGHDVIVISDCTCYEKGRIVPTQPEDRILANGIRLARLPFDRIFTRFVSDKLRKTKQLRPLIDQFAPDVILFHGCAGNELLTVAKYKEAHPHVKLYADSHEDFNNSARNFLSKNTLHRLFYKPIAHRALPWIDRIFYLTEETKHFMHFFYKIPEDKLEFYPLGGTVFSSEERNEMRATKRNELGLGDNDILLCHSGKLDIHKRTESILTALSRIKSERLKLVIIGNIPDEMKPILKPLIEADKRVTFLGWKSGDELLKYLCACDMYVQPGSQSATMQNALCCGAPVMLYPHISHTALIEKYGMRDNSYFVKNADDIEQALKDIMANPEKLAVMGKNSLEFAEKVLDYRRLAARLYE